ncbi:MAG: adenine-specific methyltransferase EcoRI family protein [Turicibacter sp.]|nr:adenine-specific methyltransferase EcoRI family protein [Turicibacter sp.]
MAQKTLQTAKKAKADEFYTKINFITDELLYYIDNFRDKTIFCNCDDPYESNFFKYFAMNFNVFGLKKLIATCYVGSPIANTQLSLFPDEPLEDRTTKAPHKIVITEVDDYNNDGVANLFDVEWLLENKKNVLTRLNGDGDFRSQECVELLKEADIVVTNPPFSLFREYVAQLVKHDKKFIIIGNQNALTYKEIFSLIKEDKLWLGYYCGDMSFSVPEYYEERTSRFWVDENGKKWRSMGNICWFTNFDIEKRNQELPLYKKYSPEEYPHYDNYNAINVDKVLEIPYDWGGAMGVPITFLDKHNPKQFEIIALGIVGSIDFSSEKKMEILKDGEPTGKYTINAKGTLYRKYNTETDKKPPAFKDAETGELYQSIYARIIIRRIGETQ